MSDDYPEGPELESDAPIVEAFSELLNDAARPGLDVRRLVGLSLTWSRITGTLTDLELVMGAVVPAGSPYGHLARRIAALHAQTSIVEDAALAFDAHPSEANAAHLASSVMTTAAVLLAWAEQFTATEAGGGET